MKRILLHSFFLGLIFLSHAVPAAEGDARFDPPQYPARLKRADSFLGIHFDFHAGLDCTEVGKNTTRAMVEAIVDQVHPDYLQIDCKGHPGISSYPTKVGHPAPGFVGDPLKIWRQVTAERGVSLFMHYSGVLDYAAVNQHPEWARVNEAGKPDGGAASTFGPYVDQLLIPQLEELSDVYGVDGVWVDGECWAVARDYCDAAIKKFREETGFNEIPRKPSDPHWLEWNQFQREAFRQYVRHYVTELHRHNPKFQLASNWAFSEHMPEPVSIDVDFLSGDFSPVNSVNTARFSARCLAPQGKPWDLMAWSFAGSEEPRPQKTVPQLEREAAVVLAQGGGFQAYFRQKRDGSIYDWQMKLMADTAKFCRARQEFCHHAVSVPQIALLYSTEAHYRESGSLFQPDGPGITAMKGTLHALLDSQYSVDIRSEHHLHGHMKDYPVIVVPEWTYLDESFCQELVQYAREGGNLLLIGPNTAGLFATELDLDSASPAPTEMSFSLEHDGWLVTEKTFARKVNMGPSAQPFDQLHVQDDPRSPSTRAASITQKGLGRIAVVWFNFGERFTDARSATAREFLSGLAHELFPHPMVEVTGSHRVEVALTRNHGKLMVNLINTSGPHAESSVLTQDEVTALGTLDVTLRLPSKPKQIHVEPGNRKVKFAYHEGEARMTLPRLEIHDIIVVD